MTAEAAGAITPAEFAARMAALGGFPGSPDVAVAVSGGPDSLALTLLAQDWVAARGGRLLALTVDHALRAGSAAEAATVGRWLAARQIRHRILAWTGAKPRANLAAAAREARYALLFEACRAAGLGAVLLAHHREDQAETFLLRLGRGSGADGLAAMEPVAMRDGIALLRPLLDIPRARLRASLEAAGQAWIEDPSNADPARRRTRIRALLPALDTAGLPAARIAATAARMRRVRMALDHATADLLARAARFEAGRCVISRALLAAAPEEIALRALDRVLRRVGGRSLPPRLDRLERALAAVLTPGFVPRTYSGCRLSEAGDAIRVAVEPPRRQRSAAPPLTRHVADPTSELFESGRARPAQGSEN